MEKTIKKTIEKTIEKTIKKTIEKTIKKTIKKTIEQTIEQTIEKTIEKYYQKDYQKDYRKDYQKDYQKLIGLPLCLERDIYLSNIDVGGPSIRRENRAFVWCPFGRGWGVKSYLAIIDVALFRKGRPLG